MIEIYADGACRGNQYKTNIGGYGAVIILNDKVIEIKEAFNNVTNNRMEILSIIKALEQVKYLGGNVCVYSDSQYVVNTMNLNWRRNANIDLWGQLDNLIACFSQVNFYKVKGHSNNEFNNRADELANEAMDALDCK